MKEKKAFKKYRGKPLSLRFEILGNEILKYCKTTNTEVNMCQSSFYTYKGKEGEKICVACLCGHLAYLFNNKRIPKHWIDDNDEELEFNCTHPFVEGAKIVDDILFDNHQSLEDWADKHPNMWGNNMGKSVFRGSLAFNYPGRNDEGDYRGQPKIKLEDIGQHFLDVSKRIIKAKASSLDYS